MSGQKRKKIINFLFVILIYFWAFNFTHAQQPNEQTHNLASTAISSDNNVNHGAISNKQPYLTTYKVRSNQIPVKINGNSVNQTVAAKGVCSAKHDHPSISKKKNYNHMDEDCCPDPDEWANPGCAYSAAGMALMLNGPKSGHVKR